ncbi:hypothetical protein DJ031_14100 [bacterium endosymbiont of Escarpia laminata]|nr:MAG: hypothetical protein DJ031_14100 [bacterium endosymbiont of Escarpia laminata]
MSKPLNHLRQNSGLLTILLIWSQISLSDTGLEYLNQLRTQAGMVEFRHNNQLTTAAGSHAYYLDINRNATPPYLSISAHTEIKGNPGFSGIDPGQRVVNAGYGHALVKENVTIGKHDARSAIDNLMSAIYHRFTFLDFAADEIGISLEGISQVFNLGRSDLQQLCTQPPAAALSSAPVNCLGTPLTQDYFTQLCHEIPPQARFRKPWPEACPGGMLLNGNYMEQFCRQTPPQAIFSGTGRYYTICHGDKQIDAEWLDAFCSTPPAGANYDQSGEYYEICKPPVRVTAEWFRESCRSAPDWGRYTASGNYLQFCANPVKLREEYIEQLTRLRHEENPEIVLWPPKDAVNIPPAFYSEDPDPLPDYEVSGYPVSIQINPALTGTISLDAFTLHKITYQGLESIKQVRLLNSENDPNHRFTHRQFALFPLQRLDWNQSYLAIAKLRVNGSQHTLKWTFTTQDPGGALIQLDQSPDIIRLTPGLNYALYWPPTADFPILPGQVKATHHPKMRVELNSIDLNTLRVRIQGETCFPVTLRFPGMRNINLLPDGC